MELLIPGTTVTGTICLHARLQLFEAATVDIWIATLEPHHEFAGLSAIDEDGIDRLLFHRAPVGNLGGVDYLDVGS
ncbi:hypothetical protein GOEFS_075_00630 [Gordonia effusa NBRC 100432]|uniref:Uncharacterized protein n=1 Tax=Gordonia effusa NBRC 100432 TaxID=1077974 RepID=H0R237_9ACTN|nr:hypothetical protein GOEFS_075_00630 [Gordonia effusa NBRC 100432]